MKLWILKARTDLSEQDNPWNPWYDKAFGFVVRAETAEQARQLVMTNEQQDEDGRYLSAWFEVSTDGGIPDAWLSERYSTCVELTTEGERAVLLLDLRQGA